MGYVEIAQLVFIVVVFSIGVIGFIKAATSDDEKKK
jgi:hypothetical protein